MNSLDLPQILYQPFAATGDKNTILNSPSTDDPQRANLQTGFPPITQIPIANGGIPPERMDFNGLGYLLSSFYFFTQCGGVYTFNQDVSDAIGGYPLGAVLHYTNSDNVSFNVRSLLENNTYNFVENPEYIDNEHWAYDSNIPKKNIGEIITSSIPLTDAGLHLLDGSLIQSGGIYDDFVQYIAGLVNTYPQCFCSEADWQQSVNTYGVCGKFVYSNNSVRLPKITGFIEGTVDSNALGDLIEAGLPNHTHHIAVQDASGNDGGGGYIPAYSSKASSVIVNTGSNGSGMTGTWTDRPLTGYNYNSQQMTNASDENSIYGNSNTVQPQSIKVFYYIVVANSTKTNIEVDIDEVITDLNSKANNADVVHLAGTETISGNKKFTGMTIFDRPISAGSSDLSGDVVTTEAMLKANDDTLDNCVKLGNGLLIQWGHIRQNSQQLNVTFHIPFKNTAYRMFTQDAGQLSGYSYAGVTGVTRRTTGATLYSYYANRYYDWLAIGFWY